MPGEKQKVKKKEEEKKSVITKASYAFNHHHGWRTQAVWTKRERENKIDVIAMSLFIGKGVEKCIFFFIHS